MERTQRRDRSALVAMLAPSVIFLFLITAVPLGYVLYSSFSNWVLTKSPYPRLSGFGNYVKMFADPYFYNSLKVTAIFTVGSLILEIVLGTLIALLLFRKFRGRGILRSFILIPMMITPAVIGLIWRIMLNSDFGIISYILTSFGVDAPSWLADTATALPCLIAVDVWEWTPFVALSVLAALQTRSQDQIESALIDGAGPLKVFRYITFPHIQPILFIASSFRMGALLRWFDTIYVMTAGGPGRSTQNLPMYIYQTGFYYLNMGYSATIAVFLLALTIAVTYLFVRQSKITEA
ncbi:MAG: sugar ABC transporter permease [Candidatus Limiplasma sp.]|nr:sugar ABC transporter permease [Candidatus Limiplasma sp.]